MELATAALGSLLPKLGSLLADEYSLQKGARGEIRFLKAEMESMQAVLNDLSTLPPHQIPDLDKIWMRNLKELSYDIEDSVDAFMVRVDAPASKPPSLKGFRRFIDKIGFLNTAKNRHKIAIDMKDIKRRIQEVAERRARYNFNGASVQPYTVDMDPRVPALYEDVKMLVGIDGPAEKLINLLTQGEGVQKQHLMVVSIAGVGGLGKTTLANSVYRTLRGQFECQAFVSVSLKPNMKKIFSSILRQISGMDYAGSEAWSHIELIDKIRTTIEKKRYIIVIDDLWDVSAWTQIRCALVDNHLGSRVIVTTRNVSVATCCSPTSGGMYELDPLSEADSKRLLYKRIFSDEEGIHPEQEEVMKKILKKCGGIPLAIITIASMLASVPSKTMYAWHDVYNSMGSGLEKDKSHENMRRILYLSYSELPSYLKPCLLYLSMFPEDYEIQRDELVRMWVAEGFVDEKQGRNLYELGDRYFNELVNRSMIQPVDIQENGSARACRVHDMILDLIISISAEENLVTILESLQLISPDCNVRRLSLHGTEADSKEKQVILATTVNISHVRSLIASCDDFQWMPPLSRFSALRVLSMEYFHSKNNHPMDLGSLHHLRYLQLDQLETDQLLEGIGNLQFLKTLKLSSASIIELPASIVQLR